MPKIRYLDHRLLGMTARRVVRPDNSKEIALARDANTLTLQLRSPCRPAIICYFFGRFDKRDKATNNRETRPVVANAAKANAFNHHIAAGYPLMDRSSYTPSNHIAVISLAEPRKHNLEALSNIGVRAKRHAATVLYRS